jgi:hypothetical protein
VLRTPSCSLAEDRAWALPIRDIYDQICRTRTRKWAPKLLNFTHQSIETILAIYAAVVSTCSIYLGIRAHKLAEQAHLAAGPLVSVRWDYDESAPDLIVSVVNSGRSDVTIYDLTMGVVQETVTRMSPTGRSFDIRMTNVELIETRR